MTHDALDHLIALAKTDPAEFRRAYTRHAEVAAEHTLAACLKAVKDPKAPATKGYVLRQIANENAAGSIRAALSDASITKLAERMRVVEQALGITPPTP